MEYGLDFDGLLKFVTPGEEVFIVDFSIEPEEMKRLLERTEKVVWIDHHKTAIAKYEGFDAEIPGIRSVQEAGCVLTWRWMVENEDAIIPDYVKLIGDRDTWKWEHGDDTRFFHAGMMSHDTHPLEAIWKMVQDRTGVGIVISDGRIIQRYKERVDQDRIREMGFWVQFEGHRCYAVNGLYSSEPFEVVEPDADIWLTFRYMPAGFWTVSLYSTKVDVSEIAKKFEYNGKRGGGHTGAAGFQCSYPPFLRFPSCLSLPWAE